MYSHCLTELWFYVPLDTKQVSHFGDVSVSQSQVGMEKNNLTQQKHTFTIQTRSSAIAEGLRDASCQLKSCQLPRNSAETTYTRSPDRIDGMKLEI